MSIASVLCSLQAVKFKWVFPVIFTISAGIKRLSSIWERIVALIGMFRSTDMQVFWFYMLVLLQMMYTITTFFLLYAGNKTVFPVLLISEKMHCCYDRFGVTVLYISIICNKCTIFVFRLCLEIWTLLYIG